MRSITFFNTEQAQKEREKEANEQRQIFKLSASVERLVTLQPGETESDFMQGTSLGLRQYSSK